MSSDFKEILESFVKSRIKFLIVGGYALVEYAEPRFTKDLDIWVAPEKENARRVVTALTAFGAPLFGATEDDFATPGNILQLGVAPVRVDIITSIDGVEFDTAWANRAETDLFGVKVPVISLEDLIKNKESTGREQDKLDAKLLKTVRDKGIRDS